MWPLRSAFVSGRFFSGYKERQRWIYEEFGLKVLSKSVYNLVRSHPGALLKVSRPVPLEEACRAAAFAACPGRRLQSVAAFARTHFPQLR